MLFSLFNSIASWLLKKRIYQIELFTKYPKETQLEVLNQLIQLAKSTEIGKTYDFATIDNHKTYETRLPIVDYETIFPMIERARLGNTGIFWPTPIKWFAKSSGTTNAKSKFIPVSNESLKGCHYKSMRDLLCLYFHNNTNSKMFTGKSLRLGGSMELYEQNGTYFGDLSSILIDNAPLWAELLSKPSSKVSLMNEWESKLTGIVNETVNEDITSMSGVPSWMLVLLNRILEKSNKNNILEVWPNLEVYFHGGVSFEPYRQQYKTLIPNDKSLYYQTYNASEGFFGIQSQNDASDMLLMLDYGIFYEFIPMNVFGTAHQYALPVWEVEIGVNYAMVISTGSGLWRYLIGDTVTFTSISPHKIKVTGRTKHFLNTFGEELMVSNTDEAIARASSDTHAQVKDYTVAPIFMEGNKNGGHEWMIEFQKHPGDMYLFRELLDNHLKTLNSDYEAKRYNDITLGMPKINVANKKLFYNWLSKENKLGGQNKVPRLLNDRTLIEKLLLANKTVV